jgi:hypothetical protein
MFRLGNREEIREIKPIKATFSLNHNLNVFRDKKRNRYRGIERGEDLFTSSYAEEAARNYHYYNVRNRCRKVCQLVFAFNHSEQRGGPSASTSAH